MESPIKSLIRSSRFLEPGADLRGWLERSISIASTAIFISVLGLAMQPALAVNGFDCSPGREVNTSLGEGVMMRTCLWEKEPGKYIRIGPLELRKNGIMILKTQTNTSGQLHGLYTSWSDEGEVIEKGLYDQGKKQGPWIIVDKNGNRETLNYDAGNPVKP